MKGENKKIGRPTKCLKEIKLTVRVSKKTNQILEQFCKQENLTKVEGIRRAIDNLPIKKR